MKEAQAARLKAEEEAAKKRRAAAAAAEDDAEGEAEGTGAEPAPAKSHPAREAPDTRTAGGKKVVGKRLVTSTGKTIAVEKPAGPEASASAVAATAGDLAARSAQQTAFLCFAALAFAAAVVFVLQELVLLAGLSALRGWARWLGIVQSVIFSLSVGLLPFGAPILLGLTNAGTVLLFTEARRLRAAGQFRD